MKRRITSLLQVKPISEYAPKTRPTRWGNWRYTASTNELDFAPRGYPSGRYHVDMDRMTTAAACLDWIFQVSNKTWMTNEDRGDLLLAIQDLVESQSTLCPMALVNDARREPTDSKGVPRK